VRVSWFGALKTFFFLAASLYLAVRASQAPDEYKVVSEANRPAAVQQSLPR
jgi:hypothetical protein